MATIPSISLSPSHCVYMVCWCGCFSALVSLETLPKLASGALSPSCRVVLSQISVDVWEWGFLSLLPSSCSSGLLLHLKRWLSAFNQSLSTCIADWNPRGVPKAVSILWSARELFPGVPVFSSVCRGFLDALGLSLWLMCLGPQPR